MMKGDSLGYYEVLEIDSQAGQETIKQQYYRLAKKWHPDHNPDPEAEAKFQKVSIAYNILRDNKQRLKYDILSQAYDKSHFPDMDNLKIYTNHAGNEEVDLRHIRLIKVTGKILTYTERQIAEICNYKEAVKLGFKTSVHNWLLGWWNIGAIPANIKALVNNQQKILTNYAENFTLLAHNMLAYGEANRYDEAYASGRLALRYASPDQAKLIQQYMDTLPYMRDYIYPQWKIRKFKIVQMAIPMLILCCGILLSGTSVITTEEFNRLWKTRNNIDYFQEVRFQSGGRTVDDMVVSKVVSIPVDTENLSHLYHLTTTERVMYGPDKDFDVLATLPAQTTVRLTGYTPDEQWARIMIDNGEMGFIPFAQIKRGQGKDIPDGSKIYTGLKP